ncbi:DUF6440 family protein, partial [Parablautia intestinalis]|uniref:DUF6440 family protein n=1 Tax=Parablautia intestinalis TaxID=2320100 RepID=UPI002F3F75BA
NVKTAPQPWQAIAQRFCSLGIYGGILMERFKKIYKQGTIDVIEIWIDTQTGVNYIFHRNGNAAGFTPLLDKDGKPVISQ